MEPEERPPLDYFPPRDDRELRSKRELQRFAGAALACLAVVITVFLFIISSLQLGASGPLSREQRIAEITVPMLSVALLMAVSAYQYFVRKRLWFVQGVLIGVAVAALIEGACFGFLKH